MNGTLDTRREYDVARVLRPLLCANEGCRELLLKKRRQVIAEGSSGSVVRAKCGKCGTYTMGRV